MLDEPVLSRPNKKRCGEPYVVTELVPTLLLYLGSYNCTTADEEKRVAVRTVKAGAQGDESFRLDT